MKSQIFLLTLFSIFFPISAEIVIGNTANKKLTADEVRHIYLGKTSRWPNGDKIIICTLKDGEVHNKFMNQCLYKKSSHFTLYWKQLMFTGRGVMPISFEDEIQLIEFVKKTKGTIGYVSSSKKSLLKNPIQILFIYKTDLAKK